MCDEFPSDLMKPGAAAKLLQVSVDTIYRLMESGTLPFYRGPGRARRVSRRDAVALVQPEKSPAAKRESKKDARRESLHERDQKAKKLKESLARHGLSRYLDP